MMTSEISITELEAAINYWRHKQPAQGEELRLSRAASLLAEPYAMLIMTKRKAVAIEQLDGQAQEAIRQWLAAIGQAS
jgi:hypothetical protein